MMISSDLPERVDQAIQTWTNWLTRWAPPTHRGRQRLCRRCTGSPLVAASGFASDTPHQVVHALVSRLHRVIERAVDTYTADHLPVLQAELDGAALWKAGEYNPNEGLDAEYEGIDHDPVIEEGEQPYLFTFAELAESTKQEPALPRPPLTPAEKQQLRQEIELADRLADSMGQEICFLLLQHQDRIRGAVERFVDPHIQALLEELSRNLESPGS